MKFVLIHVQIVIHSILENKDSQVQMVVLINSTKNTDLNKKTGADYLLFSFGFLNFFVDIF